MISHFLAEQACLGAALSSPRAVPKVLQLGSTAWAHPAHAEVFEAIAARHRRGEAVDPLSILAEIQARGTMPLIAGEDGGQAGAHRTLATIAGASRGESLDAHMALVADADRIRRVQSGAAEIAKRGLDPAVLTDPDGYIAAACQVGRVARLSLSSSAVHIGKLASQALSAHLGRGKDDRVAASATGLERVDALLDGGFWPDDQNVFGARPSDGKSAIMLLMALNGAKMGHPQMIFALEESRAKLVSKMICIESGIDTRHWKTGRSTQDEKVLAYAAVSRINNLPIWIDDESTDWPAIEARAEAWVYDEAAVVCEGMEADDGHKRLPILWGDYLQLARFPGVREREREIAEISRAGKLFAKGKHVCWNWLAQLKRPKLSEARRAPNEADLRESGTLEQDASVVGVIFHPDGKPEPDAPPVTKVQLIFPKNRDGERGAITLGWRRSCTRFEDASW